MCLAIVALVWILLTIWKWF